MNIDQKASWARVSFLLGVSLIFTHELDAMTHAEWQVLPLTSWLQPELGRVVFVTLHVPLFAFVLGCLTSRLPDRVRRAQFWVCLFMLLHAGLHAVFSSHPAYSFDGILSNSLIFGSAICGAIYLLWQPRHNTRRPAPD